MHHYTTEQVQGLANDMHAILKHWEKTAGVKFNPTHLVSMCHLLAGTMEKSGITIQALRAVVTGDVDRAITDLRAVGWVREATAEYSLPSNHSRLVVTQSGGQALLKGLDHTTGKWISTDDEISH